ncbi:hypothetical protein HID58_080107 [Brassica napus]|uniref:Uncharacterized protein n=1 Tax=Brassica napus TaxID=3708 RepID=A0ABQ7Y418_BRANA|nr:hypothetical protein HID58_080107 [Brassica napus]
MRTLIFFRKMAIFEVISKVLPSDLKSVGVLPDCCDSGRSGMLKAVGLCVLICSYWIQSQREIKESLIRSPTNNPKNKKCTVFHLVLQRHQNSLPCGSEKEFVVLYRNLTTSDLVKDHLRYLMGGRSSVEEEVLCKFTFPERHGALMNFLDSFSPRFSFVGDIDTSAPFESDDVDKANIVASDLESTKAIVEELKSKLHGKEDNENCDMNVLKELNQAKTNLCKTTVDLAAICESVELLNKRLEEERAALEKTRERLNSENAAEISKEIQRLSDDVLEFTRFAVDKAVFEIERMRSKIKAAEMRLVAARKMKEAARVAEAVAIAEIKDVTRSSRTRETLHEETLEKIEEMAQEIRSSKRTIEEGLERVNSAKMEAEE